MTLPIGLLLFSDYTTAELVDHAVLAERLGYRDFWYTDVRFARDCYLGLAACAFHTSRIRLGTGVTDPYARHPALTAAAIATLDEMSDGRAVLGLGAGGTGMKELAIERKLPVAALRETIEMVRGLVKGERLTTEGKVVSIAGGKLTFAPRRSEIPVFIATHGAQVSRLAGQLADGVLIANTLVPSAFDFYVGQLDQGLAKAGRAADTLDIGLRVEACIADDDAAAFAVMRKRVATRVLSQYPHWEYLAELGLTMPEAFTALAIERPADMAERAAALFPEEAVPAMVLGGNADRVAEQLARALHPRITSVTLRPHALRGQVVGDVIRAFAEDVLPRAMAMRMAKAAE